MDREQRLVELLKTALTELKQVVQDLGGCDHSVGICECHLIRLCEQIEAEVYPTGEKL